MAKRVKLITPLPVLGIDHSKPGEYVAARATTNAQNVRIRRSLIEKRPGMQAVGTGLEERVQELMELNDGLQTHFIVVGLTKARKLNKTTFAWNSITHVALTGESTDQVSYAFPLLSGIRILVFTNGKDAIRKYTGSGNDADLGGSPPLAKFVFFFGGYLILLNVTDSGDRFPWRVQWSEIGDPETWTGGNSGSAELLEDSEDITGVGRFGQYFTIHKEASIYVGYLTQTSAVFRFERRDTGVGAIAHRTIVTLPTGEQFFLARDGFRLFNGNTAPLIESPVNEDIRDFLNPVNAYKSHAKLIKDSDEVWCAVAIGSDTEPNTIYKFNYVTRQVHIDMRSNITAMGEFLNTEGQETWDDLTTTWDGWVGAWDDIRNLTLSPILCFGGVTGAIFGQVNTSSDQFLAIDAFWDSKDFTSDDFGLDPGMMMEWQGAHIWAKGSGSIDVYTSIDAGNTWMIAGSIALGSEFPDDSMPQLVYFDRLNARCRIRIRHVGNAQTFQFKQFAMIGAPREETDY